MRSLRLPLLALCLFAVTLLFFYHDIFYSVAPVDKHDDFPAPPNDQSPTSPPDDLPQPFPPPHIDSEASSDPVTVEHELEESSILWASRAESVKQAFLHAYLGYERYAPFPADELLPVSNGSTRNLNSWGLTMVDSLDTMLLLDLKDIFQRALSQVASITFSMPMHMHALFFETTIRYLGGFLSAYALSGEPILLSKADELGKGLLYAFDTSTQIPMFAVNLQTHELRGGSSMFLAEMASCQLEYKYLAHLTGRQEYFTKVEHIMELLAVNRHVVHGMWPTMFDITSARPMGAMYSVGAYADSAYEYLLKQYLLSGQAEDRIAELYVTSMAGILENMLFLSPTRHLLYVTDITTLTPSRRFEHLSCFFPGLLALGVETLPDSILSPSEKKLHMWAAEGLAHTCWVMYADQQSGLGAEIVLFDRWSAGESTSTENTQADWRDELWMSHLEKWARDGGQEDGLPPGVGDAGMPIESETAKTDYTLLDDRFLLRPETLESMYVMYRVTKDLKWRERGWRIWEAIESKTRTATGYTSVRGVQYPESVLLDSMPSYFLAETVKYAYLLALDFNPWPSDAYVLNTEAHPFPIFTWRDWERHRYNIGKEWPGQNTTKDDII